MNKNNETFSYNLEQVRIKILSSITCIGDFEKAFDDRYQKAIRNGKAGIWISKHEYECTIKLYRSIPAELMNYYQVLIHSARHEKMQCQILEVHLEHYIKLELQTTIQMKSA